MNNDFRPSASPLLLGAALIGAGLILRRVEPSALSLPDKPDRKHQDSGRERAARITRDGIAKVLPSNLTGSVGRTLLMMGGGLVLIRLLDMAVEEGEELF